MRNERPAGERTANCSGRTASKSANEKRAANRAEEHATKTTVQDGAAERCGSQPVDLINPIGAPLASSSLTMSPVESAAPTATMLECSMTGATAN